MIEHLLWGAILFFLLAKIYYWHSSLKYFLHYNLHERIEYYNSLQWKLILVTFDTVYMNIFIV